MTEVYKDILGYEGLYQISNTGNIKSLERLSSIGRKITEKILTTTENPNGFLSVSLYADGVSKTFWNHQLVAVYFKNHEINGQQTIIKHKDGNKLNNHEDNLLLITNENNLKLINSAPLMLELLEETLSYLGDESTWLEGEELLGFKIKQLIKRATE